MSTMWASVGGAHIRFRGARAGSGRLALGNGCNSDVRPEEGGEGGGGGAPARSLFFRFWVLRRFFFLASYFWVRCGSDFCWPSQGSDPHSRHRDTLSCNCGQGASFGRLSGPALPARSMPVGRCYKNLQLASRVASGTQCWQWAGQCAPDGRNPRRWGAPVACRAGCVNRLCSVTECFVCMYVLYVCIYVCNVDLVIINPPRPPPPPSIKPPLNRVRPL